MSVRSLVAALSVLCVGCTSVAEPRVNPRVADPVVARAVAAVDEDRLGDDLAALVAFGTRHTRSDTTSDVRGIGAARRWLADAFEQISGAHGGALVVTSQRHLVAPTARVPEPVELVNVVATLPGSDPLRVIVVSGHYDSRNSSDADVTGDAPGANDDGSGTVAVLETARAVLEALARDDAPRPRATIRFACVAGEEQGLLGSRAMAADDRAAGLDVFAMLTNDIVGGLEGGNGMPNRGRIRLFSEGVPSGDGAPPLTGSDNDAPSRQLARAVAEIAQVHVPELAVELVFRQDRYLRGGDHKAYNEQGFAAVRLTDAFEHFDRQHQDVRVADGRAFGDVLEHVDVAHLTEVTRLNAAVVLALALAPPSPTGVSVDISGLSHDTRLAWDDPADPTVAGYRVRLRATSEPTWTTVIDVGDAHELVLPGVSKDDVLFAVEAYDAAGRTSIMVYPTPRR